MSTAIAEPRQRPPVSKTLATLLATAVVYAPFVVMAVDATLSESSSLVRSMVWRLLPFAPGLVHTHLMFQLTGIDGRSEMVDMTVAPVSTVCTIAVLAWVVRQHRLLGYACLVAALASFSISAWVLLEMLRT